MTSSTLRAVIAISAAGLAAAANADTLTFTYTDTAGLSAVGSVEASDTGLGYFLATSGTLTVLASPLGGMLGAYDLVPNPSGVAGVLSPGGAFIYDDFVYTTPVGSGHVDYWGLLFARPGEEVNLYGNYGPGTYTAYHWTPGSGYDYANGTGDMQMTQMAVVPLPTAAWAGVGGLALVGGRAAFRRRAR